MRRAASAVLLALSGAAFAQQPPKLEPLPEPPPPPPGVITEGTGDQPVTISPGPNDVVEDLVIDGKRAIKVTQPGGRVYYLVQVEASSNRDVRTGLGGGVRAPTWVIKEF
jgi:hypothetical protein